MFTKKAMFQDVLLLEFTEGLVRWLSAGGTCCQEKSLEFDPQDARGGRKGGTSQCPLTSTHCLVSHHAFFAILQPVTPPKKKGCPAYLPLKCRSPFLYSHSTVNSELEKEMPDGKQMQPKGFLVAPCLRESGGR